jgi:hypothetical protein
VKDHSALMKAKGVSKAEASQKAAKPGRKPTAKRGRKRA